MKQNRTEVFLCWPVLLALLVLLVNDWFLKVTFPGWISGKLSDFSGIFVVAAILYSLLPKYRFGTTALLLVAFTFWKSPYSQSAINLFNSFGVIHYSRTVDYSDLMAFAILPIAWHVARYKKRFVLTGQRNALIKVPAILLTVFAVTATSVAAPHHNYSIKKSNTAENIDLEAAYDIIEAVAKDNGLKCQRVSIGTLRGKCRSRRLSMEYAIVGNGQGISFSVVGYPSGVTIFAYDPRDDMDKLQRELQQALGSRFSDVEFVMPLPSQR